jgi:NAD dependent epimerase/dehydratase family enzyme
LLLPNVPAFVLQLVLGELSEMVLFGSKVSCEKILKAGFEFSFPDVESALDSPA